MSTCETQTQTGDNTTIYLKETGCMDMDWFPLAQDSVQWLATISFITENCKSIER